MRNDHLERSAKTIRAKKRTHKRWMRVVSTLAAITVFCTTYALILPAITMSTTAYCGLEEHEHSEACYERQLVCGFDENGNAVTPQKGEAAEAAPATEIVTESVLVDAGHIHDESCYSVETTLICENTEEDHEHTEACYEEVKTLVCGEEEREAVYEEREVEVPVEAPDAQAAPAVEAPVSEGTHEHTDACYEEVLICEKEEHKHTDECFANSEADLETAEIWERTLPEKSAMKEEWKEDTLLVAQSQIGYKESEANYVVVNEEHKGYTRYGEMFGVPYGDWCAMFLQFSLHYAGVDTRAMVGSPSVPLWVEAEIENENFYKVGEKIKDEETGEEKEYEPKATDIIFFDWENDGSPDHVGIIEEIKMDEKDDTKIDSIITIEGNSQNEVRRNTYKSNYEHIYGYSEIPDKMTEEELQALAEGKKLEEEKKEEKAEKERLTENKTLTATIFTDNTYASKDEDDETVITVEGNLPIDKESKEVMVEARAFKVDAPKVEDSDVVFAYDITIFYKDEFRTEETGETFQPDETLRVSFESPLLAKSNESPVSYSVYYVPDEKDPELVAKEGLASQAAKLEAIEKEESKEEASILAKIDEEAKDFNEKTSTTVSQAAKDASSPEELKELVAAAAEEKAVAELQSMVSINADEMTNEELQSAINDGALEEAFVSVVEVMSSSTIASTDPENFTSETSSSASSATPSEPVPAVQELVVEEEDAAGKVSFDASHFSTYAVLSNPINGNNVGNKFNITSFTVTNYGGGANNNIYDVQNIVISVETNPQWFGEQIKAGDYFDIVLPKEFNYTGIGEIQILNNSMISATGGIYQTSSNDATADVVLHVNINKAARADVNQVSGTFGLTVPFDYDKVAQKTPSSNGYRYFDVNTYMRNSSEASKSASLQVPEFNTQAHPRALQGAEVTSIAVAADGDGSRSTNKPYLMTVNWEWEVSNKDSMLQAGDYLTIQLPRNIEYYSQDQRTTNMYNENNVLIATSTFDPETKTVRIVFTDNIASNTSFAEGTVTTYVYSEETGEKTLTAKALENTDDQGKTTTVSFTKNSTTNYGLYRHPQKDHMKIYYQRSSFGLLSPGQTGRAPMVLMILQEGSDAYESLSGEPWRGDGTDNYEVLYCVDTSVRYLENTAPNSLSMNKGYDKYLLNDQSVTRYEQGQKDLFTAILATVYPYVSIQKMKNTYPSLTSSWSEAKSQDYAIAAAQLAIWAVKENKTADAAKTWIDSQDTLPNLNLGPHGETLTDVKIYSQWPNYAKEDASTQANRQKVREIAKDIITKASQYVSSKQHVATYIKRSELVNSTTVRVYLERGLVPTETVNFTLSDDRGKQTSAAVARTSSNYHESNGEVYIDIPFSNLDPSATKVFVTGAVHDMTPKPTAYYYTYKDGENESQPLIGATFSDESYEINSTLGLNNTQTTANVKIDKKWYNVSGGEFNQTSGSVSIQLKKDGENYGNPVTLSPANGWSYTWTGIPYPAEYTAEEVSGAEGYVTSVTTSLGTGTSSGSSSGTWSYYWPTATESDNWFSETNDTVYLLYLTNFGYLYDDGSGRVASTNIDRSSITADSKDSLKDTLRNQVYGAGWRFLSDGSIQNAHTLKYLNVDGSITDQPHRTDGKFRNRTSHSGLFTSNLQYFMNVVNGRVTKGTVNSYDLKDCYAPALYRCRPVEGPPTNETKQYNIIVSNRKASTTTEFTATKQWVNADGGDVTIPSDAFVVLQLMQNGLPYGKPIKITTENNSDWSYTWSDLPVGYSYSVAEVDASSDFELDHVTSVTEHTTGGSAPSGYGVVNANGIITYQDAGTLNAIPESRGVMINYPGEGFIADSSTGLELYNRLDQLRIVWVKESAGDGGYYLRNLDTGKYLSGNTSTNALTTTTNRSAATSFKDYTGYTGLIHITNNSDKRITLDSYNRPVLGSGTYWGIYKTCSTVQTGGTPHTTYSQTVVNKKIKTTEFTVTKEWVDADNNPITPPDGAFAEVQLLQNGLPYGSSVKLENGNWTYTWTGLPTGYSYSVKEIDKSEGFEPILSEVVPVTTGGGATSSDYGILESDGSISTVEVGGLSSVSDEYGVLFRHDYYGYLADLTTGPMYHETSKDLRNVWIKEAAPDEGYYLRNLATGKYLSGDTSTYALTTTDRSSATAFVEERAQLRMVSTSSYVSVNTLSYVAELNKYWALNFDIYQTTKPLQAGSTQTSYAQTITNKETEPEYEIVIAKVKSELFNSSDISNSFAIDAAGFTETSNTNKVIFEVFEEVNADNPDRVNLAAQGNEYLAEALGQDKNVKLHSTITLENGSYKGTISKLHIGTQYYIVEKQAPSGRIRLTNALPFKIGDFPESNPNKLWTGTQGAVEIGLGAVINGWGSTPIIVVPNVANGVELPNTGGIGTVIFTALGAVLVIGAAIALLATRKRRD